MRAFSPNAIGSSFISLKIPLLDSIDDFRDSFSSSRFTSRFSGIILNWTADIPILYLRSLVFALRAFIFY